MESVPRCPSPPEGTLDTRDPDRAGTAAAEEQLLGWTGGEGEEGDAAKVSVHDERCEGSVTAGREHGLESQVAAGSGDVWPPFDFGCWKSDKSGRLKQRGRDVGPGRGEEAGPAGGEDG